MKRSHWPQYITCGWGLCGASFAIYRRSQQHKYCSRSCAASANKTRYVIASCPVCEAPFRPMAPTHRYCSLSCANTGRAQLRKATAMNFKAAPAPNISRAAWQADPTSPVLAAMGDAGRTVVVVAVTRQVEADRLAADPGGAAPGRQP